MVDLTLTDSIKCLDGISPNIPVFDLVMKYTKTLVENVYIFYWYPAEYKVDFSLAEYILEIDTVSTFDSTDKQTFTSSTSRRYYNGNLVKGYEVEVFPRNLIQGTFYWRVKSI